jgi:alkyl hydroperoxide reductase subunit AhpC
MLALLKRKALYGLAATAFLIGSFGLLQAQTRAEFSLRGVDGGNVTSDSLKGRVVVLAFGPSWLPLSRNQLETIKKISEEYAGRGVVAYWVSTDSESPKSKNYGSDEQIRALAGKYGVKALRDPDGALSKHLGVDELPATVIVDKQGNVAGTPLGGFDPKSNPAAQIAERLSKIL